MRTSRIVITGLLCLLATGGASAQQEERPPAPYIEVSGTGEVSEAPDVAWVEAGIDVTAATAEAAQQQANAVAQRILAALRQVGIPEAQIRTTRASLNPVYQQVRPEAPRMVVRYQAVNTVRVEVRDLDRVGAVIDAATRAGANTINGPIFDLRDPLPAQLRALQEAARAAQRKVAALAAALGLQVEGPIYVREGAWAVPIRGVELQARRAVAAPAGTPIEPGRIRIEAMVTLRYAIRDGARPGR